MHVGACVCAYVGMHVCVCMLRYVCVCVYRCVCVCVNIVVYMDGQIYTHMCAGIPPEKDTSPRERAPADGNSLSPRRPSRNRPQRMWASVGVYRVGGGGGGRMKEW